jgi:GTP-binding protein HflX
VDTAGAEVVGQLSQQLATISPSTLIGEGKVQELRELCEAQGATLVIFDEELSPAQGQNLEAELKIRVMDRAEIILDIFATRARSHEAKLQVELAQMRYMLPRLRRMWTHLSRIRGGIGLRGPGETQLETDRRMIRKKISYLVEKLGDWERHRETVRAGRDVMLTAALVGYTNAGKSSLLRSFSGEHDIFVEDRLFATLDTLTRMVDLGEGYKARMTDTVGFIRKLPHHLVASFRATLEEAREADVLLHVVDASHPEWQAQVAVVQGVLQELGLGELPVAMVFNKLDAVEDETAFVRDARHAYPDAQFTSTLRTDGIIALKRHLQDLAKAGKLTARVLVPFALAAKAASLYREMEVLERTDGEQGTELLVRAEGWQIERLREAGLEVAL